MESSFSLIGIDAAVANAFRRIMIAEIPSLAIETVFVNNNTSIIQDEVLSARLGLVPFKGSKQGLLEFLKWNDSEGEERNDVDHNTVLLNSRSNVRETRLLRRGRQIHLRRTIMHTSTPRTLCSSRTAGKGITLVGRM